MHKLCGAIMGQTLAQLAVCAALLVLTSCSLIDVDDLAVGSGAAEPTGATATISSSTQSTSTAAASSSTSVGCPVCSSPSTAKRFCSDFEQSSDVNLFDSIVGMTGPTYSVGPAPKDYCGSALKMDFPGSPSLDIMLLFRPIAGQPPTIRFHTALYLSTLATDVQSYPFLYFQKPGVDCFLSMLLGDVNGVGHLQSAISVSNPETSELSSPVFFTASSLERWLPVEITVTFGSPMTMTTRVDGYEVTQTSSGICSTLDPMMSPFMALGLVNAMPPTTLYFDHLVVETE